MNPDKIIEYFTAEKETIVEVLDNDVEDFQTSINGVDEEEIEEEIEEEV